MLFSTFAPVSLSVFIVLQGVSSSPTWSQPKKLPDLLYAGVEELIAGLEKGAFTSVDLTKAYILRIEEVNSVLHAVTEINPDALSIAASLDAERANGTIRSALHGIPILLKNNIATRDQMNNTAGSLSLLGATVSRDSPVAAKLRASGAILLGKANLSQWANFRSSNTSNGWSAHGGQVTGAYYPDMDPSGSSSGSAVGSSIGLALASLGTETWGSILSPSSQNNLVGIKPTVGLTSRSLVIPISEHQDTVGPMARTVSDAAYILSIIAGKDEADNYTLAQPWDIPPDYTRALKFSSFKGTRIGIPRNALTPDQTSQPVLDAFEEAIQVMKNAGAIIIENANYSAFDEWLADAQAPIGNESIVLDVDFSSGLPKYLAELTYNPNKIYSLTDELNYTQSSPLEEYPERNTAVWEESLSLDFANTDYRFWQAFQYTSYLGGEGGVTGALDTYGLDALILPTDFSTAQPAYAGLPVVTVPLGFYPSNTTVVRSRNWNLVQIGPHVPFGLSFLGPKWSEELLIGLAYAYEQRTHTRMKAQPYIIPNIQLGDVM
ncbi:amidase [Bisporella sp. PMI_857]|nr:amidase [Bisporella sp. PMI_857]